MIGEWTRELTRLQKEAARMERLQADRVRQTKQTERAARELSAAQGRAKILAQAGVTPQQLQRVVCDMGYMRADMPARDYPKGFVDGWCLPNCGRLCRRIRQSDKGETWSL